MLKGYLYTSPLLAFIAPMIVKIIEHIATANMVKTPIMTNIKIKLTKK